MIFYEGGAVWDLVGKGVKETKVVEHLVQLKRTAKEAGIPVFYSPHYYTENEFKSWKHLNPIDKIMFDRKMFSKGKWRADFRAELQPDNNTFVLALHTGKQILDRLRRNRRNRCYYRSRTRKHSCCR